MGKLLQTYGLTKQFGKHRAVDHVDVHVNRGAIYGFIGRNGAGKTTFLRMICGLATGTVWKYDSRGESEHKMQILRYQKTGIYRRAAGYCRSFRSRAKENEEIFSRNETKTGDCHGTGGRAGFSGAG